MTTHRHHIQWLDGQPGFSSSPVGASAQARLRVIGTSGDSHEFFVSNSDVTADIQIWDRALENAVRREAVAYLPRALSSRQWLCAVTGCKETSSRFTEDVHQAAFTAGRMAAELGWTVLTGGLSGVMSRAAQGARSVGGPTVGILPGERHAEGNAHLDIVIPSGIGYARNYLLASACDMMICLPGGTGTMEELCFALDFGRPVLSWGSWEIEDVTAISLAKAEDVRAKLIQITKKMYENIQPVGGKNEKQ